MVSVISLLVGFGFVYFECVFHDSIYQMTLSSYKELLILKNKMQGALQPLSMLPTADLRVT